MSAPVFTTATAALELGVTRARVNAMIASGRLKAIRLGRDWMIEPKALDAVRDRKPGRPSEKRPQS
jgi:excisionase family DNA binding protein